MLCEVLQESDGAWRVHTFDCYGAPLSARFEGLNARQAANEYAIRSEAEDWLATFRMVLDSLQTP